TGLFGPAAAAGGAAEGALRWSRSRGGRPGAGYLPRRGGPPPRAGRARRLLSRFRSGVRIHDRWILTAEAVDTARARPAREPGDRRRVYRHLPGRDARRMAAARTGRGAHVGPVRGLAGAAAPGRSRAVRAGGQTGGRPTAGACPDPGRIAAAARGGAGGVHLGTRRASLRPALLRSSSRRRHG